MVAGERFQFERDRRRPNIVLFKLLYRKYLSDYVIGLVMGQILFDITRQILAALAMDGFVCSSCRKHVFSNNVHWLVSSGDSKSPGRDYRGLRFRPSPRHPAPR